ncbi:TerD family protein [Nocardia sp. NPDC058058]|uniref:TerD family protein n=1 Tax=Nocardia sp. NPDC058058 TaxID=3346317 RepID=UPI0036DDB840
MPGPRLSKGQNLPLPDYVRRIRVVIGWTDPQIDIDASALLLGSNGKVASDSDFVFYNQPASPGGSVRFLGISATDDGVEARIAMDLSTLSSAIRSVAVVGSLDSHSFGALGDLTLTIVDENEHVLAEYITVDATTESALQFGEVYRHGNGWKVRAIGQGWASGLAGLATDFGVDVDGEAGLEPAEVSVESSAPEPSRSAMPPVEIAHHDIGSPYRLWTQARKFCDYELTVEPQYLPAIRSLYPRDFPEKDGELRPVVELIPEPNGPLGQWAVSVRTADRTIGYLGTEDARRWAGVVRRIIASGFVPTTSSRIWAREDDGFDGVEFRAYVQLSLGDPDDAIPLNEPPAAPYTMLPRSSIVQVTKEDEYFDSLRKFVPHKGFGLLFVTLGESVPDTGRGKPHVEVRVDGEKVGQLTPQMSQRFLPMIRHLRERGLITACWADITGSAVAAKLRIDAIKANEATSEVLDGPPATIPKLGSALPDPLAYDLTPLRTKLVPLAPIPPLPTAPIPAEPPEGSVVRFEKGGRYNYVAVRRGNRWETTATGDWGSINEAMAWTQLASRVRKFDIATAWSPIDPRDDARVRVPLAVIRFTVGATYIAAINVRVGGRQDGDWYTTITAQAEERLPLSACPDWSEIVQSGRQIQVVTAWAPIRVS